MMNLVSNFQINKNISIQILVPGLENKFNYYYKPTRDLNRFDEITVIFCTEIKKHVIAQDMSELILDALQAAITSGLEGSRLLPESITGGELGKSYNIEMEKEDDELIDYSNYSLWSGINLQTWLYNKNNKIFLEISPTYPFLFSENQKRSDKMSFQEFMKKYKPITIEEISFDTAKRWLKKTNELLEKLKVNQE